jgi:rRNA-processing protein FCF1
MPSVSAPELSGPDRPPDGRMAQTNEQPLTTGIPCVTDCVIAELEKLGPKYRIALRVARDPRFERLPCSHGGTYADDCLVHRVTANKCYIVATCDRELRRRIRKVGS